MIRNILCLVLFLTLFAPSLTYAKELAPEEENDFVVKVLGREVVEDAITRRLAFEKAPSVTTYTVKEGDNLFRIAVNHSVPVHLLMEWNGLENTLIHPGKELIIYNDEKYKKVYKPISVVADVSGQALPKTEKNETKIANSNNIDESARAVSAASNDEPPSSAKELVVTATAYTAYCEGCSGTTAYGINLRANPHLKVIAVDPNVIPLGTKVWVEGYGYAIAGDTGGAIKGNKIDVFIPSYDEAMKWGVKKVKVKILDE
ncbi:3D domain-containing protein [Ureibacillus sp. FSL K6-8385]|uniref:LysM peptidoglycan-binding domain-containing protein n=1 Tax=Ureibacillus terrenus TaxID=118246 RepID=A0A540V610_9BACL|nr:3D domain-containing protein [Ureibacillus terrenus]MED3660820.1 3D domain-containing protein [Ureibacillus terrenus]MED3763008.1 3D domain-containing protein [Ureibacillus terrenus]TQE92194.1 LysM peptidoglycan-binding domain-containing protein [Ureibacillus terrenus]